MTNKEYADSLRLVADFYETHIDMPLPLITDICIYPRGKANMANVARMLGTCKKEITESFFNLHKTFGSIQFYASEWRDLICERIVVGTEEYEEEEDVVVETKTVTKTRDIVEWKCPESLLG